MFMPTQVEAVALEQIQHRERAWQRDSLVRTTRSSDYSVWRFPMSTLLKLERTLVQMWIRGYQRRRLRSAVATAYTVFAGHHPLWVASLFDRHFVNHRLLPILIAASEAGTLVTPEQVAKLFANQFSVIAMSRARYRVEVMHAAAYFLQLLAAALDDARLTPSGTTTPVTTLQVVPLDLPTLS